MVEHTNVQSICDKNNETNEIQIPHAATRQPFPFEEFFFAFRTTVIWEHRSMDAVAGPVKQWIVEVVRQRVA